MISSALLIALLMEICWSLNIKGAVLKGTSDPPFTHMSSIFRNLAEPETLRSHVLLFQGFKILIVI